MLVSRSNAQDTVHAVTKAICQKLVVRADDLQMLPSSRRDLTAVCADSTPRYYNYITFGEIDARGFEQSKLTLRLDFDRVAGDHRTEVSDDGAQYMLQHLRVFVESPQQSLGVEAMRQRVAHMQQIVDVAAEIEAEYGGRDLYLLLFTAEEVAAQAQQRLRFMLSQFIEDHVAGMREGQSRQVMVNVAERFSGIAWPSQWIGLVVGKGLKQRTYDVSVGNVAVMVTRTA